MKKTCEATKVCCVEVADRRQAARYVVLEFQIEGRRAQGAWEAQSVKCPPLGVGSGRGLTVL